MSLNLSLHTTKTLFSVLLILAGLGFNFSLHEVGIYWHYPVLSLLFTSGLSIVLFGFIYLLVNRSNHPRSRLSASIRRTSLTTPAPQTNIQITTTWRWEFQSEGTSTSDVATTPATSTANIPLPTSKTYYDGDASKLNLTWARHKHFLVCGLLLTGEGLCSVFATPFISYQWQIFAFQFIFPLTYLINEYAVTKTSSRQRHVGLIIVAFGGLLNGIPGLFYSSFNGWCGMFAGSTILSAIVNVYIGYLCSIQFHPVEIAAWSNVYFFAFTMILLPLYAFTGLQKGVHGFSDLFWYQRQGIKCLTTGSDCHPYSWAYALAFVVVFSIYFVLQATVTQAEDPSVQMGISSLALPLMGILYQAKLSPSLKLLYPIASIIIIVVGIVVCKMHTIAKEYSLTKAYRF